MDIRRNNTVAIVGLNHNLFDFPLCNNSHVYKGFKETILDNIYKLNRIGYDTFIFGGESGFEIICAEMVKIAKKKNPNIKLICALPYATFSTSKHLEGDWKNRYIKVASSCDEIVNATRQEKAHGYCYQNRYEYMVDNSKVLLCYNNSPKVSVFRHELNRRN